MLMTNALCASYRHLDVADEASVTSVVADIENDIGPIAVLINSAGLLQNKANVKDEAVLDFWKGERPRDLQVAQLQGHRDETILGKITNLRGSGKGPNPWINSD
jgi:NAD(P)-dependent dehydrogenase (short-subunit alcohol dehydrogenase family)